MAKRKITKKIRVVEPDNAKFGYEWTVEDNQNYYIEEDINKFYFTYNNINYYFTKSQFNITQFIPGDKFEFDITGLQNLTYNNTTTIQVSTSGDATIKLNFTPGHKWSNEYIYVGADAKNVICSDGVTVQEKLDNIDQNIGIISEQEIEDCFKN